MAAPKTKAAEFDPYKDKQLKDLTEFEKIDRALGLYYAQWNRSDYYTSSSEPGKFSNFCDENGFDEEDIAEELGDDMLPEDCMYVEFDEINSFPMNVAITDPNLRQKKILEIIRFCWKNDAPPSLPSSSNKNNNKNSNNNSNNPNNNSNNDNKSQFEKPGAEKPENIYPSPLKLNLNFLKNKKKRKELMLQAHAIYTSQCGGIFSKQALADDVFMTALSIGLHNNGVPFLQYLTDIYLRQRIEHILTNPTDLDLNEHAWTGNNFFMKRIRNQYGFKIHTEISSSIASYLGRICPKLHLKPIAKIKDDLYVIARYIVCASQFITYVLRKNPNAAKTPFQFDLCIAVRDATSHSGQLDPVFDDSGESSSDSDSKNSFSDDGNGDDDDKYYDCIGELHKKLENNRCLFESAMVDEKNAQKSSLLRSMSDIFDKFVRQMMGDNDKKQQAYPRNERIVGMVDRRKMITKCEFRAPERSKLEDKYAEIQRDCTKDEITFFSPPKNCNKLPSNKGNPLVSEAYFDTIRQCLIPRLGYDDGKDDYDHAIGMNCDVKTKVLRSTIASHTAANGGIITFSFQVESSDCIRCYLWWRGQCTRFMPQDILDVLPNLFEANYAKNQKFVKDKEVIALIKNCKFKDKMFEYWYESITQNNAQEFLNKYGSLDNEDIL